MNISRRTMEMLSRAQMYAAALNLNFIGTEHVLLALSDTSMTPVDEIMEKHGVSQTDVMEEIVKITGREPGAFTERESDPNEIFTHCRKIIKKGGRLVVFYSSQQEPFLDQALEYTKTYDFEKGDRVVAFYKL